MSDSGYYRTAFLLRHRWYWQVNNGGHVIDGYAFTGWHARHRINQLRRATP